MPTKKDDLADLLRQALAQEAESVVRNLFYARRADLEGRADIAATLRAVADGESSQAFGHLEYLEAQGSPEASGSDAVADLGAVVAAEEAAVARYQDLAERARRSGSEEVAEWFESVAAAERAHLVVLRRVEEGG